MPVIVSTGSPTAVPRIESAPELRSFVNQLGVEATDLAEVCPADARELSKVLFARLRAVVEESEEHSYVRATLVAARH